MNPKRYSILLVDDEQSALLALRRSFYKEPCEIVLCQSAREALRLLGTRSFDVVIADECMPGMTGTELFAQMHDAFPGIIRILITGNATLSSVVRAVNHGHVFSFLTKPTADEQILHTVNQALRFRDLEGRVSSLIHYVEQQENVLEQLEKKYPGITRVEREIEGRMLIDISNETVDK